MAKFNGVIGYAISTEVSPGVWEDVIVEHKHKGDWFRQQQRWQPSSEVNQNFNVDDELSIVSDPFAYQNIRHMKYVTYLGVKWAVQSFAIRRPRIVLQLGGVYTG